MTNPEYQNEDEELPEDAYRRRYELFLQECEDEANSLKETEPAGFHFKQGQKAGAISCDIAIQKVLSALADERQRSAELERERDEWQTKVIKTALQGEEYCSKLRLERDSLLSRATDAEAKLANAEKNQKYGWETARESHKEYEKEYALRKEVEQRCEELGKALEAICEVSHHRAATNGFSVLQEIASAALSQLPKEAKP